MESANLKKYENRLYVSKLIIDVILEKITVQKALSLFPKDNNDINIKCAFDALMHREADEDLRLKIKDYKETQDEFLINLAEILKDNQSLPKNIIQQYLQFHNDNLIPDKKEDFKNILKKLKRSINF